MTIYRFKQRTEAEVKKAKETKQQKIENKPNPMLDKVPTGPFESFDERFDFEHWLLTQAATKAANKYLEHPKDKRLKQAAIQAWRMMQYSRIGNMMDFDEDDGEPQYHHHPGS